jgi:hypothetical protein
VFDPFSFVGLLVGLDSSHLSVLFLLDQLWRSSLFIHLADVGVGDFALAFAYPRSLPCIGKSCGLICCIAYKSWFLPL